MGKQNKLIPVVILLLVLLIAACGSEEEDPFVPDKFRGTYQFGNTNIVDDVKVDSVEFIIVAPGRYTLHHWDYGDGRVDFCDSEGNIRGVGTPVYRFFPEKYTTANCDSANGANREIFDVTYRRDSLWLAHPTDTTDKNIYEFALVRVR